MPCTPFKIGDISGIVCTRGRTKLCGWCSRRSTLLCDWKVKKGRKKTCDAPMCATHALEVATEKHLCPNHQRAYAQWLAQREQRSQTIENDDARQADADFGAAMDLEG